MDPDRRARLAAALGLLSMLAATTGCVTCGVGYGIALVLAVGGWLSGRSALRVELDEERSGSEAAAWARIGLWSSGLGGLFSALVLASVLVWVLSWSLGIGTLVAL